MWSVLTMHTKKKTDENINPESPPTSTPATKEEKTTASERTHLPLGSRALPVSFVAIDEPHGLVLARRHCDVFDAHVPVVHQGPAGNMKDWLHLSAGLASKGRLAPCKQKVKTRQVHNV